MTPPKERAPIQKKPEKSSRKLFGGATGTASLIGSVIASPSFPPKPYAADGHGERRLGRLHHRDAYRTLKRLAVARHAGAANDDDVCAVALAQRPAHFGHAPERAGCVGELGHP